MRKSRLLWIAAAWCTVASIVLGSERAPIVENGRPRAAVVIPASPDEQTKGAAELLVEYVKRSSGAKLTIVEESAQETTGQPLAIYLGPCEYVNGLGLEIDRLDDDGLVSLPAKTMLLVAAEDARPISKNPSFEHPEGRWPESWSRWIKWGIGTKEASPAAAHSGEQGILCKGMKRGGPH